MHPEIRLNDSMRCMDLLKLEIEHTLLYFLLERCFKMLNKVLPDVLESGEIDAAALARKLNMTMSDLASLAGVGRNALAGKPLGPKPRGALQPVVQILATATEMTGSEHDAIVWFKFTPIISMGVKTAEQHVRDGNAHIVLMHLESVLNGVYA